MSLDSWQGRECRDTACGPQPASLHLCVAGSGENLNGKVGENENTNMCIAREIVGAEVGEDTDTRQMQQGSIGKGHRQMSS